MAGLGPAHFAFVERGQGVHPARSRAGWTLASQASTREGVTPGSPEQTGALVWVALGASPLTSSLLNQTGTLTFFWCKFSFGKSFGASS